jgi:hypothetical protein
MLIAGGPGLLFAAIAHDPFRVPVGGTAYEVFGPLHVPYIVGGALLVLAGLVSWVIALRGGVAAIPEEAP